jgi:hypothetical protein
VYLDAGGRKVDDPATLERIRALVRLDQPADALSGARVVAARGLVRVDARVGEDVRLLTGDATVEGLARVHLGGRRTEVVDGSRRVVRGLEVLARIGVGDALGLHR